MKALKLSLIFIFITSISLAYSGTNRKTKHRKKHKPQRTTEFRNNTLDEFETDGCSMYPDGNFMYKSDWIHCCIGHDISYWYGGTKPEKEASDKELNKCVANLTGENHGSAMEMGVGIGGSPTWGFPWSWGYGWIESDFYIPVSADKSKIILEKTDQIMNYVRTLPTDLVGEGLKPDQIDYIQKILNEKLKDLNSRSN